MISAQIKKGNTFLIESVEDHLLQVVTLPPNRTLKPLKINYYNFIEILTQIISQFSKSKSEISLSIYIVDFFVRKYQKSSQLYRHFFGFTQAWKKYSDCHEDARLFLSLLGDNRNSKDSVKNFIKIRKIVLKTTSAKFLQQIPVTHSDALTICHLLFENCQIRNKIIKKINTLFISLKRKLVNTAKVNGAVASQFFMNAIQQIQNQLYPLRQLQNYQINQNKEIKKSMKVAQNELSFSQEYASHYGHENIYQRQKQDMVRNTKNDGLKININKCEQFQEIQEIQNEWNDQKGILNLQNARKSLTKLSLKDRDIDARLQGTGLIQWRNYPQGWDQFIRNNQIQKQRLLNGAR